ncbi:MAG: hypothetical protein K8W52_08450 [Deltaproteobacteria bacterium]|nr:hypothetical protein [Deltaproteobacteria bacterium]
MSLLEQLREVAAKGALAPGEEILHALPARIPRDRHSALRLLRGVGTLIEDATRARTNPLPFTLPAQMVLGLTGQQLLSGTSSVRGSGAGRAR